MKRRAPLPLWLCVLGPVLAAGVGHAVPARTAPSAPPAAASSSAPSPAASGSPAEESLPELSDDPPGDERSAAPTEVEWGRARHYRFARPSPSCAMTRVREWVSVRCRMQCGGGVYSHASADQVTGDGPGIRITMDCQSFRIVMPLRRGDARVFQGVAATGWQDYQTGILDKWDIATTVISEYWLPGAPAPTMVIQQ